jgi:hypothetical protein
MSIFKRIILPLNIFKTKKTSVFGDIKTQAGPGNEGIDLVDWINQGIDEGFIQVGGGGNTDLTNTPTSTTILLNSSNGDDTVLPAATTSFAGVMTADDKIKLDTFTAYVHPNHVGDVTSISDGTTTISNDTVTNVKLANMPANTVKVRNVNNVGDPVDMLLLNNNLVGRGSVGDIAPITLGTNLSMSGNVLNATGQPVTDGDKGDIVVSGGGNVWGIDSKAVSNVKLADMPANTVKVRNSDVGGVPVDLVLPSNTILGRGELGNIVPLTLGTNIEMNGDVLDVIATSGATNISEGTRTTTTVQVLSDTGTDATLSPATTLLAGVMPASDKIKLNNITITQAVDLDDLEQDVADLTTLSGVPSNSLNLGAFTGTIISDTATTKDALQALETAFEAGGYASNGIVGAGKVGLPYKIGGTFNENTGINASGFNLNITDAGTIQLESDAAARTHRSELLLTGGNTIGAYMRHINKSDINQNAQVSLDLDTSMGLTYQAVSGQEVGFRIIPAVTTADTRLSVVTPNVALGTVTTGQVLTRQADGSTEYQNVSASGSVSRISVTPLSGTGKCTFTYTGLTAPTFTRNSPSVWTINVPTGTELLSADIFSAASANPGSNVTLNINTASTIFNQDISTALIPLFTGVALSGGTGSYSLTTGTPNLQPTISVAPVNGDIQFLINNYNTAAALGSGDSILKLTF